MSTSAIKAGSAFVEISARDQQLRDALEANKKRMQQFVKTVAVVGAAAVVAGAAAGISAASDMEETLNKFNVVFGENRQAMKAWADEFAQQVGRSKRQVAEFLANTQDLLIPVGLDESAATNMSQQITKLAVDVASFNNKLDADVLRDFHAALTGGGETVKKYGIVLDVAATKAKLLEAGIDPTKASNAQKVWARWQIILEGSTAAQGDAVRSGDSYANQMKRLQAQIEDLAAAAGNALLPVVSELVKLLNAGITPLVSWVSENRELVTTLAAMAGAIGGVVIAVKAINAAMALYAQRAAVAQALSGPAGWATLAIGLAAAGTALTVINDQLAETEVVADAAANAVENLTGAARKTRTVTDSLKTNTEQLAELFDKEKSSAEKLATQLDKLAERQRILERLKLGGRFPKRQEYSDDELADLRSRLIDSATGFGDAMQAVRDEIGRINGSLTESEIKLRQMAEKGLPADELKQLAAAYAELDAAKSAADEKQKQDDARQKAAVEVAQQREAELDKLKSGADQIREAMKTPAEKFSDMVAEMRQMIKAGVLDKDTANAYARQKFAEVEMQQRTAAQTFQANNSNDLRSSEGAAMLARLLNGQQTIDQKQLTTMKRTEKHSKETADGVKKLSGAKV